MKKIFVTAVAGMMAAAPAMADLVFPSLSYRTGPYAAGGIPFADGYADYFTLLVPGRHRDYLICTSCGRISPVNAPCPVHDLEAEIRRTTGYRELYHELEFFGLCPECQQ